MTWVLKTKLKEKLKILNNALFVNQNEKLRKKFFGFWLRSFVTKISIRKESLQAKHFYYFKKTREVFDILKIYKDKSKEVSIFFFLLIFITII